MLLYHHIYDEKISVVILTVLVLVSLISCSGNPAEDGEQVRILVPKFMRSDKAKGLTQLADPSQQSPFEDAGVAAGVMSTMPILSELSPHDVKSNKAERVIEQVLGSVTYPFGFKVKTEKVQLNDDGLYCYFNIYEEERWCGYFDYYYNTETHCFSYRELVVVTTKMSDEPAIEYNIVIFDYNDIPVEKWNTDNPC